MPDIRARYTHERYDWLDQARGLVGLLFVISFLTWEYRGDVLAGDQLIAPPHLDHGFSYLRSDPPIITLVDIGQATFMYFVGISAYIAFTGRRHRHGPGRAWRYAAVRLGLLWGLSVLNLLRRLPSAARDADWLTYLAAVEWYRSLCTSILATIAAGALAVYVSVTWLPRARQRLWLAVSCWTAYAFVHALYLVDRDSTMDFLLDRPPLPMATFSLAAVAVFGSCCGQWIQDGRHDLPAVMKHQILPASLYCVTGSWCLAWLQPADHHEATPALVTLAAGLAGMLIGALYAMAQSGVAAPILKAFGRNLLLVFLVTSIACPAWFSLIPEQMIRDVPLLRLLLVGILPLLAVIAMVLLLDKKNIVLRF